jgi:hypothetical protein
MYNFKDKNFNIFDHLSMFYVCSFDVRLAEEDLRRQKNVEVLMDCMF